VVRGHWSDSRYQQVNGAVVWRYRSPMIKRFNYCNAADTGITLLFQMATLGPRTVGDRIKLKERSKSENAVIN